MVSLSCFSLKSTVCFHVLFSSSSRFYFEQTIIRCVTYNLLSRICLSLQIDTILSLILLGNCRLEEFLDNRTLKNIQAGNIPILDHWHLLNLK